MRRVRRLNLTNDGSIQSDQELALNENAEVLEAGLKEVGVALQTVAETSQSRRKIQVRRMRRVRRLNLTNDENAQSDQTESYDITTSQVNEQDEVELS